MGIAQTELILPGGYRRRLLTLAALLEGSKLGGDSEDFCCTAHEKLASGGICPTLTCDDALRFLAMDESHGRFVGRFWCSAER